MTIFEAAIFAPKNEIVGSLQRPKYIKDNERYVELILREAITSLVMPNAAK